MLLHGGGRGGLGPLGGTFPQDFLQEIGEDRTVIISDSIPPCISHLSSSVEAVSPTGICYDNHIRSELHPMA